MPSVLLVGTPNSGKTALFNRLTGLNQRVANYPGITVDLSIGRLAKLPELDLVDFPGTYSLRPISEEVRPKHSSQSKLELQASALLELPQVSVLA